MSYTAGVYYDEIGFGVVIGAGQAKLFEKLSNLLAFVLVDFTAERIYRKSFHNAYCTFDSLSRLLQMSII